MPLSTPPVLKFMPGGSAPVCDQVMVPNPPLEVKVALGYARFANQPGNDGAVTVIVWQFTVTG